MADDDKNPKPKFGEPGFVYNEDGAQIENPGPVSGPKFSEGKPIGYPQLGDRVMPKVDPETVRQPSGDEVNLGDKDGGRPLTPSEPGSAGLVRQAEPLDHDGDGKKGGSKSGANSTASKGAARKAGK